MIQRGRTGKSFAAVRDAMADDTTLEIPDWAGPESCVIPGFQVHRLRAFSRADFRCFEDQ